MSERILCKQFEKFCDENFYLENEEGCRKLPLNDSNELKAIIKVSLRRTICKVEQKFNLQEINKIKNLISVTSWWLFTTIFNAGKTDFFS